jgi:ABC-2 type transport system permease protein
MLTITKWTIWQRRWSIFGWSLGVFSFILITMVFYPSFKESGQELAKTFEDLPPAAVQLFGGSTDFFSPVGYLNSQIFFIMLPLLLCMLAVALGSSIIGREEQDGTLETLLARPVARTRVLVSKARAGAAILAIVSLVAMGTVVLTARIFGLTEVSSKAIALATFNTFLLAWSTGAIAFLLAATGRARGAAIGVSALIGFGGYLVTSLSGTVDWLKVPAKAFPFNYFQSEAVLNGTYHWVNALFFVGVILGCGILSYVSFRRRDIV